jgi:flagellar M-ring protein FliF
MFRDLFSNFSSGSRATQILVILSLLAIIAAVLAAIFFLLRPNYQVLFSNLKPQDAATLVAELERLKISHRLEKGGATILVPDSDVHAARLKIMSRDLPLKGTVGFELFNNSDLGLTEFAQKVNYQRALQGELARTIMSMDQIESARIHLALPESTLFKRSTAKVKASVALLTRDGVALPEDVVKGIQRLVAAAIPDLEPADVTILDQRGAPVSNMVGTGSLVDDPKLAFKIELERYCVRKVLEQIEPVVGAGNASVSVDAQINFDQVKITQESSEMRLARPARPTKAEPKRSSVTSTSVAPGMATSQPTLADPVPGESVAATTDVKSEPAFRRLEQTVAAPGSVKRMTVAVILHGPVEASLVPRVNELISAAIGLSVARGDVLSTLVRERPHGDPKSVAPEPSTQASTSEATLTATSQRRESKTGVENWPITVALGLVAIILVLLALLLIRILWRTSAPPMALTNAQREQFIQRLRAIIAEGGPVETRT